MRWTPFCRMSGFVIVTLLTLVSHVSAGTVPIRVDRYIPDSRGESPTTFGVPFPQNALPVDQTNRVRVVDDQGKVVPHQQNITATWDPHGSRGVRWLLVDFQPQVGRTYSLTFGEDAPAEPSQLPDVATLQGDTILLDNGPIKGTITTRGFNLFSELQSMKAPLGIRAQPTEQQRFSGYYVEHETKGVFRSDLDPDATVVLEETGPMRATIKADGWYTNAAGEKFCRYSIRMHFFREKPEVKIEHTFIFTGLSKEDRIRSVGIKLDRSTPEDGARTRLYAGDADLRLGRIPFDSTGFAHLAQITSERDRFDFISRDSSGTTTKIAEKGGGWMSGGVSNYGFSVAIRDAWQQYPWALRFDRGLLDVQLWSSEGGLLDTTWDGYWSELTDHQKRYLASGMQRREQDVDKWMDRLRAACNATGAAKTHEVWLACFGPSYGPYERTFPSMSSLARDVAYPTIAYADPAWTCSTAALDWQPHWPSDTMDFPEEDATLHAMLPMMRDAITTNNWYGWWDWGGYHQHLRVGLRVPRSGTWADDAGEDIWHRARPKSHYQWGRYPWVQFMRSGKREWLLYAQTFTLYSADRAHAHYTGNGRDNGAEYHYDNSVVPWMGGHRFSPEGDQIASNLQAKDDYVYAYWLTGSRRALDVLKANGELLIDNHAKGGSWSNYPPGFSRGNDIRNAGMQLERVMMLYQATWDERYLPIAKRLGDAFVALDTQEKVAEAEENPPEGTYHQAASWAYQGMWFYDRVVGDPAFRKALMAFIERARDYNPMSASSGNVRAFTYGYLLTKDPIYLDLGRASWDYLVAIGITPTIFNPGGKQGLSPMPGFLGLIATASESWRNANLPTNERGGVLTWRYAYWGENPHMQPTRAFFRETTDQPWSFVLVTSNGGTFAVFNPEGKIIATQTLDPAVRKWAKFEIPSDGMSGDYTLMCVTPKALYRQPPFPEMQPEARVLQCDLPMVAGSIDLQQMNLITGRSLHVQVDPQAEQASVFLGPLDPNRSAGLIDSADGWSISTADLPPLQGGHYTLKIPASKAGARLQISFSANPEEYYPILAGYPCYLSLNGLLPYIAVNAKDFFVPKIPASYEPYPQAR